MYGINGIKPYQFEPPARQGASDAGGARGDPEAVDIKMDLKLKGRAGRTEWCLCGHCKTMEHDNDSVCCREIPNVWSLVEQFGEPLDCIISHPWFESACLNQWTLKAAYMAYSQQNGRYDGSVVEKYRFMAKRQLVWLAWGKWLGRTIRWTTLPSCVVSKIVEAYPADSDQLGHFSDSEDSSSDSLSGDSEVSEDSSYD